MSIKKHLQNLEALIGDSAAFTSTGVTVGEIYLWSVLHQIKLVKSTVLDEFAKIVAFYNRLEAREEIQKVLKGESSYGELTQYFIPHES